MMEQARQTAEELGLDLGEWGHLQQAEEQKASVALPPGLEFIWETFIDLCNTRQNGFSANPITWAEMLAWSRLYRIRLDPFEVAAVKMLDLKWLSIVGAPDGNTGKPQSSD